MATIATAESKKRVPKRLSSDELKSKVQERMKDDNYKGANIDNIDWGTLEYDDTLRRQMIVINTVGENGKLDGNTRRVATSDLQHVCHTKEVSDILKRKRNNAKRAEKRKTTK